MLRRSKRLALLRRNDTIPDLSVLPDSIIQMILLRVPYQSHSNLKAVCRQWRDIVSKPEFYKDRMATGTREQLICMIQYFTRPFPRIQYNIPPESSRIMVFDPANHTWAVLRTSAPNFPGGIPLFCTCVCVNRKLVVIGGWRPENCGIVSTVYIFDFVSAKWRRGADMPTLRIDFACSGSSSTGVIYVAGGRDNQNPLTAAESYNVEEDQWEILPSMTQPIVDRCHGAFIENKFFVFSQNVNNAEIFDPNTGVWKRMDNIREDRTRFGPAIASSLVRSGHELYALTDHKLIKFDTQKNSWIFETFFPQQFSPTRCTAEWRGHLFFSKRNSRRQVCGLFNLSTEDLIELYVPRKFEGFSMSAATVLEI